MSEPLDAAETRVLYALTVAARGPRRNGLFALWLVLRAAAGLLPPDLLSTPHHALRLEGLARRLSSLSLPAPLRRALAGALSELREGAPLAAAAALRLLVAPVRETLGPDAADAVTLAAREARAAARGETPE